MRYFFNANVAHSASTHLCEVMHMMAYGQSLSVGLFGEPSLTVAQPYGNVMFNTGIRTKETEGGDYTSTIPLVETDHPTENRGETGVVSAANFFVEKMTAYAAYPNQGFVVHGSSAGRGGMNIRQLTDMVQAGYDLAQEVPRQSYGYLCTLFTHGEADQQENTPRKQYREALLALSDKINAAVTGISGQKWRPFMLTDQPGSHLWYHNDSGTSSPRPEIALALRDAALASPDIFNAMPLYMFDHASGGNNVHMINYSYQNMGYYYGRAAAKITKARLLGQSDPVVALDLKSAVWQGRVIDLQFHVPHGPLVLDTSWVADTWNKGFDLWQADGLTLQDIIGALALVGPDRVQLRLNNDPAPGSRLTYGFGRPSQTLVGRTDGPRGNLRDSESDIDSYVDDQLVTRRLDNYCLIFEARMP